jgi:predicted dehydrogenase
MIPCEADDQTLIALDFGDALFAFAYGVPAGGIVRGFAPNFFGTDGTILGLRLNGEPLDYPGREVAEQPGASPQWLLPHVTPAHRGLGEEHVFEDIMQLVDWVRDGTPSPVTAEHARHVIEIIEAAYRAAATGHTQDLTTAF